MAAKESKRGMLPLVIVILVAVVAVGGAAFYQEHLTSAFAQQAWNSGAAEAHVREFARLATTDGSGDAAAAMLSGEYEPEVKNGRLESIQHGLGMARKKSPVGNFVPGEIKSARTEFLARDGGSFRILVEFANGKWGEFRVKREGDALRLTALPGSLTDDVPPRDPNDY